MQTSKAILVLAVSFIVAAAIVVADKPPSPVQEALIRKLYEEVLSKSSAPISVAQTKDALERLLVQLKDVDQEGYNAWRVRIEQWLKASEISRDSCNHETAKELAGLIRLNQHYSPNVLLYLEDCQRRQEAFCKTLSSRKPTTGSP